MKFVFFTFIAVFGILTTGCASLSSNPGRSMASEKKGGTKEALEAMAKKLRRDRLSEKSLSILGVTNSGEICEIISHEGVITFYGTSDGEIWADDIYNANFGNLSSEGTILRNDSRIDPSTGDEITVVEVAGYPDKSYAKFETIFSHDRKLKGTFRYNRPGMFDETCNFKTYVRNTTPLIRVILNPRNDLLHK